MGPLAVVIGKLSEGKSEIPVGSEDGDEFYPVSGWLCGVVQNKKQSGAMAEESTRLAVPGGQLQRRGRVQQGRVAGAGESEKRRLCMVRAGILHLSDAGDRHGGARVSLDSGGGETKGQSKKREQKQASKKGKREDVDLKI